MSTKIVPVNSVRIGSYIIIDGAACRVADIATGKSGKHGHAKARIVAIGLIDEKRREIVIPTSDTVESPIIDKRSAQVLSITGDSANIMDVESYETFDLKISEDLKGKVNPGDTVLYWVILGEKVMKQVKYSE